MAHQHVIVPRKPLSARLPGWIDAALLQPLTEPVLHPSRWRTLALGWTAAVGNPLFYLLWSVLYPQPYESLALRMAASAAGALLFLLPGGGAGTAQQVPTPGAALLTSLVFWLTLPVLFSWMYLCNGGNAVWLASLGAMFLIYYHMTDWRIATVGCVLGLGLSWIAFNLWGPPAEPVPPGQEMVHLIVLGFCWYMGLMLGISSSNLRREQLRQTAATIGIVAHELRTPLATVNLLGEAMRREAAGLPEETGQRLDKLVVRLQGVAQNMNRQIDLQIANARLMNLPANHDRLHAAELVQAAVDAYPYRSRRERECVAVVVHTDFTFDGSRALFTQVIENLLKNALVSLAASGGAPHAGDVSIHLGARRGWGRIVVSDRGVGIPHELQRRIFRAFVSTQHSASHGLGLAFCHRVVTAAGGSIRVRSEPLEGATFTIELPLAR